MTDSPTPPGGWIEHAAPRITPGRGSQLGLFPRLFTAIARAATKGRSVNIFATLGRNHRLFRPWLMFAGRLMPFGKLPRVDSELVILRVGWNCRAEYEWAQHQHIARRIGLDKESIARVHLGPEAEGWTDRQAAILTAVDELHAERVVSDATWERLKAHLDEPRLLELCMLTGHYEMLAMTLNSAGVEVDAGAA
jgi:alkylhydroperoxidase family enzyme